MTIICQLHLAVNWTWPTRCGMMMFMDEDAARDLLRTAIKKRHAANQAADDAMHQLYDVVRRVSHILKQVDIVRETGWSREHIRQITKKADS